MKKRILLTVMAAGAALLFSGCTSAAPGPASDNSDEGSGVLRVATMGDSKPYAYTEKGEFKGFDLELLNAVAAAENMSAEYVAMDFTAILPSVNNGQADVGAASIAVTDERKQNVDFSDPYFVGYIAIVAKGSAGIETEADLAGKRLGLIQGTIHENYATANLGETDIVRFPDNNAGFSGLTSGTIDAQFMDLPVAQDYVSKNPDADLKIISEIPTLDMPAAYVVAKGDTATLKTLNSGIKKIMMDGTWLEIYTRYFPDQPVPVELLPEGAKLPDDAS